MSKKTWIIFAAVCVIVLGGLVYLSGKSRIDTSNVETNAIQPANDQSGNIGDHVFGKKDSKVVLIEYGDFQCPGCGSAYPNLKAVSDKYKGQMAFIFRNFPLTSIHPNARAAAAAAEAAGLQNKYWEMHDALYEGQSSWENLGANERGDFFANYAQTLGLNVDTFKTDMASSRVNQKIEYDQAVAKKINVSATPTIYLNGRQVDEEIWKDQNKLDNAVIAELKNNDVALPTEAQ